MQNEVISLVAMRNKEIGPEKITPLSNLTQMASRGMKTHSESRIDLRNLQMLKKMMVKSSQFWSSEQPCEAKSMDVALSIDGVERKRAENLRLI